MDNKLSNADLEDRQKDIEILRDLRKRAFMEEDMDDNDESTRWIWL